MAFEATWDVDAWPDVPDDQSEGAFGSEPLMSAHQRPSRLGGWPVEVR